MSGRSTVFYVFVICISTALAIAISALVLATTGTGSITNNNFIAEPKILFSIYDNRSQSLLSDNTWTNVFFNNHQVGVGGAWLHEAAFSSDIVYCNRTGLYIVFFSIQAQINPNLAHRAATTEQLVGTPIPPPVRPECKACNLRYSIRATRQPVNSESIFEVPGTLTYTGGQSFYLSKQFLIDATQGDLFRFQFVSLCGDLALQPYSYVLPEEPAPMADSYPASATLVISS